MFRTEINPSKIWLICGTDFSRYFPVFARVQIQAPHVLVVTSTWRARRGFPCWFSQHLGILGPPNAVKQGRMQNDDKSTLFTLPHPDHIQATHSPTLLGAEKWAKTFLHWPLEHPQGPGTSRQNSLDIPRSSLRNPQGRQTFEGGHELFDHHTFAWKTLAPPGSLRTQKVDLCALFLAWISRCCDRDPQQKISKLKILPNSRKNT